MSKTISSKDWKELNERLLALADAISHATSTDAELLRLRPVVAAQISVAETMHRLTDHGNFVAQGSA